MNGKTAGCPERFILFLLFLGSFSLQADEGIAIKTAVDRKTVLVGDPIRLSVTVTAPASTEVKMPDLPADSKFTVQERGTVAHGGLFGRTTVVYWYRLIAYEVGDQVIPPLTVSYYAKNKWQQIKTPAVSICVASVLEEGTRENVVTVGGGMVTSERGGRYGDETGSEGGRHRLDTPLYHRINEEKGMRQTIGLIDVVTIACWIFGILAVLAFVTIYRREKRVLQEQTPDPAPVTALRRLEALAKERYPERGMPKEFWFSLGAIMGEYVKARFRYGTGEMTTEELLESVEGERSLGPAEKTDIGDIISLCDSRRYAPLDDAEDIFHLVWEKAKRFVEATATERPDEEI